MATGNTSTAPPAVEFRHLTKDYPVSNGRERLRAVDDLSLAVARGEVCGLLGPNGSGKSTALKALLGLIRPTAGRCFIDGREGSDPAARVGVGYMPESPDYPGFLTAREILRYHCRLAGVPSSGREERIAAVLDRMGLAGSADRKAGGFSKGMLQRLGLAQALAAGPSLLVLDEPTAGMDPFAMDNFAAIIREERIRGTTVLLCSHLLAQVEELCDRVAILSCGRLLADAPLAQLLGTGSGSLVIEGLPGSERDSLQEWLAVRGATLREDRRTAVSLERVFQDLAGRRDRRAG
jgi:ABC-2 type transport system ATP-binding protein